VQVEVSHKRGHLEECEVQTGTEHSKKPQDIFTKTIVLDGPLEDDQRQRLLEIGGKCPVHRMLMAHVCMRTALKP
jgi:putative redox protein